MSSSKNEKIEIRYAPYIEEKHHDMLWLSAYHRDQVINSPPSTSSALEIEGIFLGAGYILSDFPSLYDMFGKFMAALDIDVIYKKIFGETITESEINPYIQAEAAMIDLDITAKTLPTFLSALRGLNAVTSSSFVIGKSNIENKRIKALARISSDLKHRLISLISDRWKTSLDWNKNVVTLHAFNLKLYLMSKMTVDETNYGKKLENSLWPFKVLEYNRAALAALTRASTAMKKRAAERSAVSKGLLVCSYTVTGISLGSSIGGPYGALIGGVVGFIVGVAIMLLE
jgi:hypothetical protein